MINGYADNLIEIDNAMCELGRPPPPVVSWISGGLQGDITKRTTAWREQLAQWEASNPEASIRWHELDEQYRAEEEIIERKKFNDDDWRYEQLRRAGCPEGFALAIQRKLDDRGALKATRDWTAGGMLWCLILSGGPGCGKTTAAAWAAHQLSMRGYRPKWIRCAQLVDAPMFGVEAELLKHKCRNAGVLVLDDIGAGAREKDAKAWLGWLDDVLDQRWANKRKTIITTNMTPGPLAQWLGPRLCDRLNEGAIHDTQEPSMRKKTT